MSDVLIEYGSGNTTGERVEISGRVYKDLEIDREAFEEHRDDQDFRTGTWLELKKHCPIFYGLIARQYPPEPIPATANYNGYKQSELCIRLCLAFLGRLFFKLNLLDKWQKALAIIGTSNVGKTKLLEFMIDFFGRDVFQLKTSPEEQFGMETLPNKRLIVVEEISSESKIKSEDMLSFVCGSACYPVSRKGLPQITIEINQPMVVVGNSFPKWPDKFGKHSTSFCVASVSHLTILNIINNFTEFKYIHIYTHNLLSLNRPNDSALVYDAL
jgi:hypothetical protein